MVRQIIMNAILSATNLCWRIDMRFLGS